MTTNQMILQGFLYSLIGALTPVAAVLGSDSPINNRLVASMIVGGLIAGATACKAFLSTTFADHEVEQGKTLKASLKARRQT
jgi:hypothetical protein